MDITAKNRITFFFFFYLLLFFCQVRQREKKINENYDVQTLVNPQLLVEENMPGRLLISVILLVR